MESHTNLPDATGNINSHSHVNTFRDTTTVIREGHLQIEGHSHTVSNSQTESLGTGETARLRKQIQDLKKVLEILETKNKTLEDNQSNFNHIRETLMSDNKKLLFDLNLAENFKRERDELLKEREATKQGHIDGLQTENSFLREHYDNTQVRDLKTVETLVLENQELRDQLNAVVFRENANLKGKVRELTENPVTIEKEVTVYSPDPQLISENQELRQQLDEILNQSPDAALRNQELLRENYALRDQCVKFEAENLINNKTKDLLSQQAEDYRLDNEQLQGKAQGNNRVDTSQTMDLEKSFGLFLDNPEKILDNDKIRSQLQQLFQNPAAVQYICGNEFMERGGHMVGSPENFDQEKGYLYQLDQSKSDLGGKRLENIQEESFGGGKGDISDEMRRTGAMDDPLSPSRVPGEYESLRDTIKGLKDRHDPNIMQIVLESMVEDSGQDRIERKRTLLQDAWAEFNKEYSERREIHGLNVSPGIGDNSPEVGDFRPSLDYQAYQERSTQNQRMTENFDPMQVESQFFIDDEGRRTWKEDQQGLINLLNREKVELEKELRKVNSEVSRFQNQMDSVALQKEDYLRQLEIAQKQLSNLQEKSADMTGREP